MPRPVKGRRVCCMPGYRRFGPLEENESCRRAIEMTVDEFEAVRLIDMEGFSQEECANHMEVARTTAQAIYGSARVKLAQCLVNGVELIIGGGTYILQEEGVPGCRCGHCHKKGHRCGARPWGPMDRASNQESLEKQAGERNGNMRIAVTYENGEVFQHFGHTSTFKVYDMEDNQVRSSAAVSTNGSGHGALAGMLEKMDVNALICGGIGAGAKRALADAGIRLYAGVSGSADQAVDALIKGELKYDPDTACDHHGQHHGDDCGQHGCNEHHHGHQ